MTLRSSAERLGAWFGKYLVKTIFTGGVLFFMVYALKDRIPDALLFFLLGAVFNDMWNDGGDKSETKS